MDKELLQPAGVIAVELLKRVQSSDGQLSDEVIAAAFEQACQAVQKGYLRVLEEEAMKKRQ